MALVPQSASKVAAQRTRLGRMFQWPAGLCQQQQVTQQTCATTKQQKLQQQRRATTILSEPTAAIKLPRSLFIKFNAYSA